MSDTKTDNPPAFPTHHNAQDPRADGFIAEPGMDLRDYFAGQALMGMLAADAGFGRGPRWVAADPLEQPGGGKWLEPLGVSRQAYAIADAMLTARKEPSDA